MANFKKVFSIFMVAVMGAGALCACAPDPSATADQDEPAAESGELTVLKSDYQLPPEEKMARFKAEYLIENKGYKDDDKVVAILSLGEDALIDDYLADEEYSARYSLAQYASSPMGKQKQAAIRSHQTDLIRRLEGNSLIESVNYRYNTIANAVAVTTTYSKFLAIEASDYCDGVFLSETYARPLEASGTDASAIVNDVDVYETGIFNSESALDPNRKPYTGKGTSVAVLDSGFDLSHQVFNTHTPEGPLMYSRDAIRNLIEDSDINGGMPLNAVQTTAGLTVADVYYSEKIPFKYDYADKDPDVFPFDSEHGTHVAGIIGGYGTEYQKKDGSTPTENGKPIPFKGIAIDTQLVLMKVFPDLSTGADTEDILAAVEDAVLLGVDAINMSLGAACGFTREKDGDITNTIYDKVNESGTSLITAAGNEFSSGYGGAQGNTNFVTNPDSGTIGSPASYTAALSVASISGVKSKYLIGNDEQVVFFNESNSISGDANDLYGELYQKMGWDLNDAVHTLDYVTVPGYGYRANYTAVDVKGKIALVSRGDNTFEDKALQAKNAGAVACIIYNNVDGDILMSMGKSDHIPTISISKEDGVKLAEKRTGTLTFCYKQEAGPFMSDFSCWGPLSDLTLKPEITAHGGDITSSVPGGRFDTISGTSMACPNLCGVVILIRQYIKDNYQELTGKTATDDASYMKNVKNLTNKLLMSTATIILNEQGNPYSPRKQGAGLASLFNVVNTRAYLEVEKEGEVQDRPKIELGDDPTRSGVYTMTFDIVNTSDSPISYTLGLIGMTESVSTADHDHVAERDQMLDGGTFTANVVSGSESAGTVNGTDVTVNAKSTLKLKLVYTLSEEDKELIDSLFPYGMYVEGFVTLQAKEKTDIDLNVPFLAFFGDWTQAPIFDKTYYEVETEAHNAGIDEEDKLKADYYATTPYGSYYINYLIPLGTYLYDMDETSFDPIPATEDRIAISDTLGAIDGISTIYAGMLRGCKTVTYTITDKATGEVVYTHEVTNGRKAFSQGGSPIPNFEELHVYPYELGLVNNRKYELKMVGELDFARDTGLTTNARNTFSFDFTVDNEAPIIKGATYEKVYDRTLKKDRYYINLTVYDNNYAMAVTPLIFSPSPEAGKVSPSYLRDTPIPLYGEKGKDITVRFEITDYLKDIKFDELITSGLAFSIEDYALNQNLFICQLPGTKGRFKFTGDGEWDSTTLSVKSINVNEVLDLTQFLATADSTVDENKDYLKYLSWESNNTRVATVENGQVVGLKAGSARITVREMMLGYGASITINVKSSATATAAEGTDRAVTPLSSDNVADVTKENLKEIRFSYFDTLFAHATAGYPSDVGSTGDRIFLTAHRGGIAIYPGESFQLHYDVSPWYVRDSIKTSYQSDRPDIATVNEDGVVTALKKGNVNITLRVEGSSLMATLRITVNSEFVIDDARTLVAYKGTGGEGGEVVIPDDEGILYIGPYSFSLYEINYQYAQELPDNDIYANRVPASNSLITSVVVPKGVMEIQQNAFYNCTKLKTVTLPDSVQFIRQDAFAGDVALESINLDDVEAIGARAFSGCSKLTKLVSKTTAEPQKMAKCYTIGTAAFQNCVALQSIDLTGLRNTGEEAFMGCTGLKNVVLGELTKLSASIFEGCGLTSVAILEKNGIPDRAFANNADLVEITLPDGPFVLGDDVFEGCKKLATVKLKPNTEITSAQGAIFSGCGLNKFEFADGSSEVYTLGDDGKQLLKGSDIVLAAINAYTGPLNISADVKHISDGAFAGSMITELTFAGPIQLGAYAFADCDKLTKVTFAAAEGTAVGTRAFNDCALLATVENLDKVVTVGDYAFAISPALKTVKLADNGIYGEGAFFRSGLTEVTIGKQSSFGLGAFQYCTDLVKVNMPTDGGVTFGTVCFSGDTKLATIDLSKAAGEIGAGAFNGCRALTKADLTHITKIGERAFADCALLSEVTFGDELTEIGEGAFMDYTSFSNNSSTSYGPSFTSITLPASITKLGMGVFYGCTLLTTVTIPDNWTEIPDYFFGVCTGLTEVTLPAGCTKVGDYAFVGCARLSKINLDKVESIGENAFLSAGHSGSGVSETYALKNANLSFASVKEIGFAAFADTALGGTIDAPALKTVGEYAFQMATFTSFTAPVLETIGAAAFQGTSLTSFNFPTSIKSVGDYAFLGCTGITDFTFGDSKAKDGKINDYAKLVDGVLYTVLQNGDQQLTAVPAGKNVQTLTVEEGTARIGDYAGNANKNITSIVLPDSLNTIADYAFYGYTALKSVEFRSVTAPKLECNYSESASLAETDPGYDLLHNQFDMYGLEMTYFNFVDLVGRNEPIAMILPSNSDISGYDNVIYQAYFGTVDRATRSKYVAMEQTMKDFLSYAEQVKAIEKITLNDEALVSKAVIALNGVKQDPTNYGVTSAQWQDLTSTVTAARDRILRLKVEFASKAVRDIQARIDKLPDAYTDEAGLNSEILSLQTAIAGLETDDRNLLIQGKYTTLLAAYQAAHPTGDNPGSDTPGGETPSEADNGCGSVIGIGGGVAAFVTMLGAAVILLKKRETDK